MDKKMHLGGANASQLGQADAGSVKRTQAVQNVGPQKAGMQPNRKEAIEGCCGHSPIKASVKGTGK